MMFNIKEELKNLPTNPGVYLMHSQNKDIIYVGKAKNLKNRVSQYFRSTSGHTPKVRAMVSRISYFEYIITDTELEALVLECNLIKKHRPKYNILLKDDKHYPFLKISMQEDYPKISVVRKTEKDGARYFGPYLGVNTINNTLELIQKIFTPPTCNRSFPADIGKGRPCLNYHIKNCFAPCRGNVSQKEYKETFEQICKFLEGDHKKLRASMKEEMQEASKNLEFEKAAIIRDKIRSLDRLDERQKIFNADKGNDFDIVAVAAEGDVAFVEVFFVRGGKVTGRQAHEIDNAEEANIKELLGNFITQFYMEERQIPPEIILESEIDDIDLLSEILKEKRGGRFTITVPKRGEKLRLIELVKKNAKLEIDNFKIRTFRERKHTILSDLRDTLALSAEPKRIECYDISNISGADSVGVMVVFKEGKKAPSLYRNFKIKTVEGADDYASTQEVLYRRLRRAIEEEEKIESGEMTFSDAKFLPLPDVIFADGGKGHMRVIKETVESMDMEIPVFGLVKDERHRTRGVLTEEGEINLLPTSPVFNFLTSVQDEVHRAAITYFRKLHSQKSFHSQLDEIHGIGKKRRDALLEHFGTISKIKNASLDDLKKVVDKKTAENIISYFKEN